MSYVIDGEQLYYWYGNYCPERERNYVPKEMYDPEMLAGIHFFLSFFFFLLKNTRKIKLKFKFKMQFKKKKEMKVINLRKFVLEKQPLIKNFIVIQNLKLEKQDSFLFQELQESLLYEQFFLILFYYFFI